MNHYSWVLSGAEAFSLYDLLPESCIFEGDQGLWHVDYYCPLEHPLDDNFLSKHPGFQFNILPDQDWVVQSALATPPVVVGQFYVHTPDYPPSTEHALTLCVSATTAFGSGHHATTQGCLQLIQDIWATGGWNKALDFGCGSGILALAMNGLNPGSAVGMDNDGDAVAVARDHAHKNGYPTEFIHGDALPQGLEFDCIVANVYGPILMDLAPTFSCASHVVLSGILQVQMDDVLQVYTPLGWVLEKAIHTDEWVSLWLKK
jgi:ribosomal protein L11 methyltransferase